MFYVVLAVFLAMAGMYAVLLTKFNKAVKKAEERENELRKQEAKKQELKERIDTGDDSADFNATVDLLRNNAKRTK